MNTVKPLNSRGTTLVRCREVVPSLEVDRLATCTPNLELVNRFYAEGCGLQEAESACFDQTCSAWGKIDKTKARGGHIYTRCTDTHDRDQNLIGPIFGP